MAHKQTVALTGASGFVGGHLLRQLLDRGFHVRALLRDPTKLSIKDTHLQVVQGDLHNAEALRTLVNGADAVVHLVAIIMEKPDKGQTFERIHVEGTQRLLEAARHAGVKRWVHMSALGVRPNAVSMYHQTKWRAEQLVRGSGMAVTVFRPSIIHGPNGEFTRMMRDFWTRAFPPFVPYFGRGLLGRGGAGLLQPVWVEDVVRCFAMSLENDRAVGETYPLGGPDVFTWPELYETVRRHLPHARTKRIVAIPVWYANLIAGLPGVPFNRDQVVMSQEDSVCNIEKAQDHFGFEMSPFEPTFASYAASM